MLGGSNKQDRENTLYTFGGVKVPEDIYNAYKNSGHSLKGFVVSRRSLSGANNEPNSIKANAQKNPTITKWKVATIVAIVLFIGIVVWDLLHMVPTL